MSASPGQLITWHSPIEILRSRKFNLSESTGFAKQLYLGVERREQVFLNLLSLTFGLLVFKINILCIFRGAFHIFSNF